MARTYFSVRNYSPLNLTSENKTVCGYSMMNLSDELIAEAMTAVLDLYRAGKIKPIIDSVWAYEDVSCVDLSLYNSIV